MSFKMLNSVDELMEYTGCNSIFIPENNKRYLVYESNTPYMCDYFDWVETGEALHFILSHAHMTRSFLVVPNPNYINLREYIREYKHLLGCEYKIKNTKWEYFIDDRHVDTHWKISKPALWDSNIKFYTEDNELVSYKEYMELYYPEYRDVWEKQL